MAKRAIFFVESVRPKGFDTRRIAQTVYHAMKKESDVIKDTLEMTTENWLHKPEFSSKVLYAKTGGMKSGNDPRIYVYPKGNSLGAQYWTRVNNGTHYIPFSFLPQYVPMTSVPGEFGNNAPRTTLIPYKIYYRKSRKRIHARNWTGILQTRRYPYFIDAIEDAIERGLQPK